MPWGEGVPGEKLPILHQRMPESEEAMDENCGRIRKMLGLYRAGKLPEDQKVDVEYHLLTCPECIFLLTLVPSLDPE
jgi:Putative zinc-finger